MRKMEGAEKGRNHGLFWLKFANCKVATQVGLRRELASTVKFKTGTCTTPAWQIQVLTYQLSWRSFSASSPRRKSVFSCQLSRKCWRLNNAELKRRTEGNPSCLNSNLKFNCKCVANQNITSGILASSKSRGISLSLSSSRWLRKSMIAYNVSSS